MGSRARRRVVLAAVAPLPAIVVGAVAAHAHGVAWQAFAPNVVGLVVGAAMMAAMLSHAAARRATRWMPFVALALLVATFASPGLDGVHRWLALPGLRVHASMALAPWALLALAVDTSALRAIAVAAGVQLVHVAQPDAGQATVLAAGAAALLVRDATTRSVCLLLVLVALAMIAWTRPDPLAPVEHVERVLAMIAAQGTLAIVAATAAALCLAVPLALAMRAHHVATRRLALAFAVMLAAAFAVTCVGHFPVPVFGAGASGLLGWCSMHAALIAARAER